MRKILILAIIALCCFSTFNYAGAAGSEEKDFAAFVKQYETEASKLEKDLNTAQWNAYVTGQEEDYKKMSETSLNWTMFHSNKEAYDKLTAWQKSGKITSPDLKRKLRLLINAYGPYQFSKETIKKINEKETFLQQTFNSYRGKINSKEVTERDIYDILRDSSNDDERKAAWEAQKGVGEKVASELIELVKLRNKGAKELGFNNFHEMTVFFADQNYEELISIFNNLAETTDQKFKIYKAELDKKIAARTNKKIENLAPWDYSNPFFQGESLGFAPDLENKFKNRNIPLIAYNFYAGIGLPLEDVLKKSDLYEKEGKSQHAFCFDMDRSGDSRILMNIRSDADSLSTLLHESGHAVYNLNINQRLPWIYRTPSHISTTEASAMFFERFTKNPEWLLKNLGIQTTEEERQGLKKQQILEDLLFCRWTIVMFNFEKELYENPDQDLNSLWWELAEKYQGIKKPEGRNSPDWASKIHLVSSPVYYHNYMMAALMVSQIQHYIGTAILKTDRPYDFDVTENKEVGRWFKDKFYRTGASYNWNELLKRSTGEELNAKYFADSL